MTRRTTAGRLPSQPFGVFMQDVQDKLAELEAEFAAGGGEDAFVALDRFREEMHEKYGL